MSLVDFGRMTITFENPKGGRSSAFTRPLPSALEQTLRPLVSREFSHEFPPNRAAVSRTSSNALASMVFASTA